MFFSKGCLDFHDVMTLYCLLHAISVSVEVGTLFSYFRRLQYNLEHKNVKKKALYSLFIKIKLTKQLIIFTKLNTKHL